MEGADTAIAQDILHGVRELLQQPYEVIISGYSQDGIVYGYKDSAIALSQ